MTETSESKNILKLISFIKAFVFVLQKNVITEVTDSSITQAVLSLP